MLSRNLATATLSAAMLSLASLTIAAEPPPMHMDTHHVTLTHEIETAQTKADHEAIAKRFEEQASKLDMQAAEHERLAKQYHSGVGVGPKGNAGSLASHCDNFVKDLKASAADAREMAELHRGVAKTLDK
jgi:hypothetical protein